MKSVFKKFFVLAILGVLVGVIASGCSAMLPAETPVNLSGIAELVSKITAFLGDVIALGAAAALVTMIVQLGKLTGIVKDDKAPLWSAILNGLLLAALVTFKIIDPDLLPVEVDTYIRTISSAALLILGFIGVQLPASAKLFEANRETPLIGYSVSDFKK